MTSPLLAPLAAALATIIVAGRAFAPVISRAAVAEDDRVWAYPRNTGQPAAWLAALQRRLMLHRTARTFGPADLATWIDDVSRSVRRGTTLRQTLVDVGPSTPSLAAATAPLRHRLDRGAGVVEATEAWGSTFGESDRRADRHLIAVAAVLSISSAVGGGASAPLDRLAAAMRQSAADDLERGAQSAQALISARVLTFVPIAMFALLLVIDGDVRAIVQTATGAALISCGLALNLVGGWWMKRIITAGVR